MAKNNYDFSSNLSLDNIQTCLSFIDPDINRDEWVKVGIVLMNELGEQVINIFRSWSEMGASYNSRDFNSTVKSIRKNIHRSSLRLGTLIFMASSYGLNTKTLSKSNAFNPNTKEKRLHDANLQLEMEKRLNAQKLARYRWENGKQVDLNKLHPYLLRKGITNPVGVKIYKNFLQVPAFNEHNILTTLQSIGENGFKSILKNSVLTGSSLSIGGNSENRKLPIFLCEGWATGQSIYAATKLSFPEQKGRQVVIAFNCHNLKNIAKIIRNKYSDRTINICADNDAHCKYNAGLLKANEIKESMANVEVVYPEFDSNDIDRHYEQTGSTPTDFNDLFLLQGIDNVMMKLRECLLKLEPLPQTSSSLDINI